MFKIEKAYKKDFERVYPCLERFEDLGLGNSKEEWRRIFDKYWETPEDFCGYMLLKDGQVKGYLGLIFSYRIYNNQLEKFCNFTTWIVDKDCRQQSLLLLLESLKLKDYIFTNFSASPTVAEIMKRLKFTEFEIHEQVAFPVPNFRLKKHDYGCEFDLAKIRSYLNENERVIFDDHAQFDCEHLLLKSDKNYFYLILKKTKRKNMPFIQVQYVSEFERFAKCLENSVTKICVHLKVLGIMVDERYLNGYRLSKSFQYSPQQKMYFRSDSNAVNKNQIDMIYSELVILRW